MPVDNSESIRLLHLSDIHFGLGEQDWMWPTFKKQFFDDLRGLHERAGPWDLVVFSGDLTQRASKEEFDGLTHVLKELWAHLKSFGSEPSLFVVPGNHDLVRPSELDPTGLVMRRWWNEPEVQRDFWTSAMSSYRTALSTWFATFTAWRDQLATHIPFLDLTHGILPGDVSATLQKANMRVGLVGLNSAWLQVSAGDLKGRLCLHARQLHAVTSNDPDAWCGGHDFNLVVTHHPVDWLEPRAIADWSSEIYLPTRFDAHLFGHMHEGRSTTVSISGGPNRTSIQAASLFGLEHVGASELRRDHGYSAIQIPSPGSRGVIRLWPRKLVQRSDGSRKLASNQDWDLVDDSYCDIGPQAIGPAKTTPVANAIEDLVPVAQSRLVLQRLLRPAAFVDAHAAVRKAEQAFFLAALKDSRIAWQVASWGTGGEEFLQCVQGQLGGRRDDVYYLDVHSYRSRDDVLGGVQEMYGCSFASLCAALAAAGPSMLVLDDVEVGAGSGHEGDFVRQVCDLAKLVLDYCPQLSVVIRSRAKPAGLELKCVEVGALEEPDVAQYVASHPLGGEQLARLDVVGRLYRHTDGIPSRIDLALRDLRIVGLNGLHELNSDVSGRLAATQVVDPTLARAIKDLSASPDEACVRAHDLLKVLSLFPQGEQLSRVRRFFGAKAFYANHASILLDRGLVDLVQVSSLEQSLLTQDDGNALLVKRPVREHLMQSLGPTEHRNLSAKALALYFGEKWQLQGIRSPTARRFKNSQCEIREITNASTLVLRAAKAAGESGTPQRMSEAVALATSYAASLKSGTHYRSVTSLYDDLFPIFERYPNNIDLSLARVQHAIAVRMIGERQRASEMLIACDAPALAKGLRQQVLLNLALCYESLKQPQKKIIETASQAERLDKKTVFALQARGIIASNGSENNEQRETKLRELQVQAVKRKAFILANNFALERASAAANSDRRKDLLREAMHTARTQDDPYNLVRSSLRFATLALDESGALDRELTIDCTHAYSYLYNQRIDALFDSCHEILWRAFQAEEDYDNMLRLFRHSSLIWRIREKFDLEKKYMDQLAGSLGKKLTSGVLDADRELLYFMTRGLQLGPPPPSLPA